MILIGTSHTSGAGYYVNDKETSRPQEDDVQTCSHCQKVLLMRQWKKAGGFCRRCMKPVCIHCARRMATFGCESMVRQVDKIVDRAYRRRQFEKVAGLDSPPPDRKVGESNTIILL
ncbi:MAG: hypothetical protein ONB55_22420 [candidate division KSB1 bacterium]|nr:hypothetical protein [candidate division KSB1 bacterium]